LEITCSVRTVGLAKATKILHKKAARIGAGIRSRLGFYCGARLYNPVQAISAQQIPELIDLFRRDLPSVRGEIIGPKNQLEQSGIHLTSDVQTRPNQMVEDSTQIWRTTTRTGKVNTAET